MSRKRYTKLVHLLERDQIERQEKELAAIETRLRKQPAEPIEVPFLNEHKVRRSVRMEQKRRRTAKRPTGVWSSDQK